jgi:hypothetical protein
MYVNYDVNSVVDKLLYIPVRGISFSTAFTGSPICEMLDECQITKQISRLLPVFFEECLLQERLEMWGIPQEAGRSIQWRDL